MEQHGSVDRLRIGVLALRVGMTRDTVRYYERLGLVRKPARPENGYRLYGTTDVGRLLFIRRGKLLGLSLNELRALTSRACWFGRNCQPVRLRVVGLLHGRFGMTHGRVEGLAPSRPRSSSGVRSPAWAGQHWGSSFTPAKG